MSRNELSRNEPGRNEWSRNEWSRNEPGVNFSRSYKCNFFSRILFLEGNLRIRLRPSTTRVKTTKIGVNTTRHTVSYCFVLFPGVPGASLGGPGPSRVLSQKVQRVIPSLQRVTPGKGNLDLNSPL